jgi:hypothetical protein
MAKGSRGTNPESPQLLTCGNAASTIDALSCVFSSVVVCRPSPYHLAMPPATELWGGNLYRRRGTRAKRLALAAGNPEYGIQPGGASVLLSAASAGSPSTARSAIGRAERSRAGSPRVDRAGAALDLIVAGTSCFMERFVPCQTGRIHDNFGASYVATKIPLATRNHRISR